MARFTGEQLKNLKFTGIISSPVLRAVQTSKILASYVNLDITVDNRAIESDFGVYDGKRIIEIPNKKGGAWDGVLPVPNGKDDRPY